MKAPNDEQMAYCLVLTAELLSLAAINYLKRESDESTEDTSLLHSAASLGLLRKGHDLLEMSRSYLHKTFEWPE